ncbi:uncharacterized protein YqkB [Virgibacillus halotolerans]|uniref:iron-sulfur cluster biosynthesis family protein n=1 Tax=Virgibacillus halotolerans TaxID=1071053 RepID=UPI00195FE750|nr:iron-sulfur cluster biosynthesis family protein [Virgibacillus halotolerans]MBM7598053.1 uncharacterized protein YqkB [Virgibacillus halotolerans]
MKLTVTPEAAAQLQPLNDQTYRYLLLWYDIDDCGCGVNGVPTIRYTNEKSASHMEIENAEYPTLIHKQQAIFFADDLKLDFANGTFRLSSPEEILNPFIAQASVCEVNP